LAEKSELSTTERGSTAATSGSAGVLRLLRSYMRWRVGISWYLVALLGIPALVLLSFFVLPGRSYSNVRASL